MSNDDAAGLAGRLTRRQFAALAGATTASIAGCSADGAALTASVHGVARPGETAAVVVHRDGEPVADASVAVAGDEVGTTDEDGGIPFTVPDRDSFELAVTAEDSQIERTIPTESSPSRRDAWYDLLQVDAAVEDVQYNPSVDVGSLSATRGLFAPYAQYSVTAGEYLPYFVTDWSADETELVLQLRDDFTWSVTGEPITAEDVAFQLDTVLRETGSLLWDLVEDVAATGVYEVTVEYPAGTDPRLVEHAVLRERLDRPPAVWERLDPEQYGHHLRLADAPADDQLSLATDLGLDGLPTSGPLALSDHDEDAVLLVPRDDHPHGDHVDWRGYRVEFRPDDSAAHQAVVAGEADGAPSLFAGPGELADFPDSLEEVRVPGGFGFGLAFNRLQEPLQHREVRQAILHLIDREEVRLAVGERTKHTHKAPTGLTAASAEGWLGADYAEGFETYRHEDEDDAVETAEALLDEVGLDFSDLEFELLVPGGWSDWVNAAAILSDQLNVSVDSGGARPRVSVRTVSAADYYEQIRHPGWFDVAAVQHGRSGDPAVHHPYVSLRAAFDPEALIAGGEEQPAIPEVEVDGETVRVQERLDDLSRTADREEQAAIVEELARAYNRDLPVAAILETEEQSFLSRDGWAFPEVDGEHEEHFHTYWPQWWLPMVEDEQIEGADRPGLLKSDETV